MSHDFDIAARTYDLDFTSSRIGSIQREQVRKHLEVLVNVKKKLNILELNCGTGADAAYMNKFGHKITATDISSEMIHVSKEKYSNTSITFQQQDITKISPNTFHEKFDLIFSNFGGFNCLSKTELVRFLKIAPSLLEESGKLVLIIMPKYTLWEQVYFYLKGEKQKARRRKTNSFVLANVQGVDVKTWYFNPSEIIEYSSNFNATKTKPIGFCVPPSYLEKSILGKRNILGILKGLDQFFNWSFLSKYADHFYIELEKKSINSK